MMLKENRLNSKDLSHCTAVAMIGLWLIVFGSGCATATIDAIATEAVQAEFEPEESKAGPNPLLERPSVDSQAMDRWAILYQAGEYAVTFDFLETVALRTGYKLKKPYSAKAKETVIVIKDTETHISLQHILKVPGMGIIKHWRQDWIYEPKFIYEFKGNNRWEPKAIGPSDSKGAWAQIVYQVDDSPRYAGVGKWRHEGNLSQWESLAARPLPRREYTKRSDYQILMARNRHTLIPGGWIHEQDNFKKVIEEHAEPIIAREVGFNVYKRAEDVDFTDAYDYWEKTRAFWAEVRAFWEDWRDGKNTITLADKWEGKKLWRRLFELAEEVKKGEVALEQAAKRVRVIHSNYLEEWSSEDGEGKKAVAPAGPLPLTQ